MLLAIPSLTSALPDDGNDDDDDEPKTLLFLGGVKLVMVLLTIDVSIVGWFYLFWADC